MTKEKATILKSEPVYKGAVFEIKENQIDLHNGKDAIDRQVMYTTDSATILLVRENDQGQEQALIEKEYRSAVNAFVWDLPAGRMKGHLDENGQMKYNEDPATTARRELAEETGYLVDADHIKRVDKVALSHDVMNEHSNVYIARLEDNFFTKVPARFDSDEDIIDYKWVSINSALKQTAGAASHTALLNFKIQQLEKDVESLQKNIE